MATEKEAGLLVGQILILLIESRVALVIDTIEGLHTILPLGGVLTGDDGLGTFIDVIAKHFKVLVFDDTGIGNIGIGEVHDGIALEVGHVKDFLFKADGAILEFA